jgi:predicted metal-dependent peptidase
MSDKLRKAVTALIGGTNGDRMFAELLFDMERVADPECQSMGVGLRGRQAMLMYNPVLLDKWSDDTIVNVLKHEVLHIILNHHGRIGSRNHQLGNIAADLVVNQMVKGIPTTLTFYKDGKFEDHPTVSLEGVRKEIPDLKENMSFEYYYAKLAELNKDALEQLGETADDHSMMGDEDGISPTQAQCIWRDKIGQAVDRAARAGDAPKGAIRDIVGEFLDTSVDWRTALRQFPQDAERTDTSRTRKKRNRRYGLLYPGVKIERKCKLAVGFDLSGSITDEIKDKFTKELAKIAPFAELTILFFDTTVTAEKEFEAADFNWKVSGGGGTLFDPVFQRAKELSADGLIMLTDGENFDKIEDPGFPVLWGILDGYPFNQAFGQHVVVK